MHTMIVDGERVEISPEAYEALFPEVENPPVPSAVSMRQARLALLSAGLLSMVDAAIDNLPEPDKSAARIEWEYATVLRRNHSLVAILGAALGLDEPAIDELFRAADSIT